MLGLKHDGASGDGRPRKARWSLLPFDALREIVHVLTKGAEKYAPDNWLHVEDARRRYFDALLRHATDWYEGERNDPEWNLHHLGHGGCCLLFLLAMDLRGMFEKKDPPSQP